MRGNRAHRAPLAAGCDVESHLAHVLRRKLVNLLGDLLADLVLGGRRHLRCLRARRGAVRHRPGPKPNPARSARLRSLRLLSQMSALPPAAPAATLALMTGWMAFKRSLASCKTPFGSAMPRSSSAPTRMAAATAAANACRSAPAAPRTAASRSRTTPSTLRGASLATAMEPGSSEVTGARAQTVA